MERFCCHNGNTEKNHDPKAPYQDFHTEGKQNVGPKRLNFKWQLNIYKMSACI